MSPPMRRSGAADALVASALPSTGVAFLSAQLHHEGLPARERPCAAGWFTVRP
jgi:hypothetical protein